LIEKFENKINNVFDIMKSIFLCVLHSSNEWEFLSTNLYLKVQLIVYLNLSKKLYFHKLLICNILDILFVY